MLDCRASLRGLSQRSVGVQSLLCTFCSLIVFRLFSAHSAVSVCSDSSLHSLQSRYQSLSGRSINMDKEMDSRENSYSSMRLQKYGCGLKITGFVSCLSWCGIISAISAKFLLVLFIRNLLANQESTWYQLNLFFGLLGLIFCYYWFYLHFCLRRRNMENNVKEIIRLLKLRCYITGGLEIILHIIIMIVNILAYYEYIDYEISILQMIDYHIDYKITIWQMIFIIVCQIVSLIFSIFKIYGVRKEQNGYINAYILFRLVIHVILTFYSIFFFFSFLNMIIIYVGFPLFNLIFILGDVIVIYNLNDHLN